MKRAFPCLPPLLCTAMPETQPIETLACFKICHSQEVELMASLTSIHDVFSLFRCDTPHEVTMHLTLHGNPTHFHSRIFL